MVGGGPWPRRSPAGLLHVLLELLHISLELGPPVLEPANNLKKEIFLIPVFVDITLYSLYLYKN